MALKAEKRRSLDGRLWWCVYDTDKKKFSTYICFGKYKTKKECESEIEYYQKEWEIP